MLFKAIDLPSNEPVLYVGCYALRWGRVDEPTVAFRNATFSEVEKEYTRLLGEVAEEREPTSPDLDDAQNFTPETLSTDAERTEENENVV